MIATAPGKLILTGEYAVLDGGPALVVAVSRRVVAKRQAGPRGSSEFLLAIVDEITRRFGEAHPSARAATEIVVDSTAFFAGSHKLGLGSSAAVTVAATALALAADHEVVPVLDREEVLSIASAAHAVAQGPRGTRGSGADIASAIHGGVISFQRTDGMRAALALPQATPLSSASDVMPGAGDPRATSTVYRLTWPGTVTLIPFFTGASADTGSLVAEVQAARERDRAPIEAALAAIEQASRAACQACAMRVPEIAGNALISALSLAASATDRLAAAAGLPLVPACVSAARKALGRLHGTAKTTGAGGGDVGIAVIPATEDATEATRYLIEAGCQPLGLTVDRTGVDLQPDAQ